MLTPHMRMSLPNCVDVVVVVVVLYHTLEWTAKKCRDHDASALLNLRPGGATCALWRVCLPSYNLMWHKRNQINGHTHTHTHNFWKQFERIFYMCATTRRRLYKMYIRVAHAPKQILSSAARRRIVYIYTRMWTVAPATMKRWFLTVADTIPRIYRNSGANLFVYYMCEFLTCQMYRARVQFCHHAAATAALCFVSENIAKIIFFVNENIRKIK